MEKGNKKVVEQDRHQEVKPLEQPSFWRAAHRGVFHGARFVGSSVRNIVALPVVVVTGIATGLWSGK